jgi:hypothetical protein
MCPRPITGANSLIACCGRATGWPRTPELAVLLVGKRDTHRPDVRTSTAADCEQLDSATLTWISVQPGGCQGPQMSRTRMLACWAGMLVLAPTTAAIVSKAMR